MLLTLTCPVCKSTSPTHSWSYKEYNIYQCHSCGLEFIYPMTEAPVDFYQENYGETIKATLVDNIHPGFRFILRKVVESSQKYLNSNQRSAIDVGCGPGYMLAQLKKLGFDEYGIDFNPDVIKVATEHFHVKAEVAKIQDLVAVNKHFDIALLIHVLEHVEDPIGLLKDIHQLLTPNSILFIESPNATRFSLIHSLKKGTLVNKHEYPPQHLTFWSPSSLYKTLELAGYQVLECNALPFGEHDQIKFFLTHRFKLPDNLVVSYLSKIIRTIGRALRLQGETLYAIARPLK